MKLSKHKTLTFKFDVDFSDDGYIPEGTVVEVYQGHHPEDATWITYKGVDECYLNSSFVELS
jgi:hypothetical protein